MQHLVYFELISYKKAVFAINKLQIFNITVFQKNSSLWALGKYFGFRTKQTWYIVKLHRTRYHKRVKKAWFTMQKEHRKTHAVKRSQNSDNTYFGEATVNVWKVIRNNLIFWQKPWQLGQRLKSLVTIELVV